MLKFRKVILIMTDTQRWDMCGCYRDTGLKTPQIDSLAEGGIRFEKAYTTQPVCQPARAAIFTGMYPNSCASWSNSMGISDNVLSLGQRLSDNGVHTAYIGKWHLDGSDYFGSSVCPAGWDKEYWYDMRNFLEELTEEERLRSRDTEYMLEHGYPDEMTYGYKCTSRALDFLQNHGEEDFFLALSFDEPHHPFMCPKPYSDMYKDYTFPKSQNVYDNLENKPDYQKAWAGDTLYEDKESLEITHRPFFGCNSYVDDKIGQVIRAAAEYAPDAMIIYTADHGDFLHSHSLSGKGPAAYDEISRIPFIIAGKGIPSGVVGKNPVSHINIAPTIMEVMGYDIPKTMQGNSLTNELEHPSSCATNKHIFIEFGRYEVDHDSFGGFQPMRTVFDGRYKLSINLLSTDELYDMESDPGEMDNLIERPSHTSIRNALHDVLLEHMNNTRDPFRGYYWERRPWRKDARQATWDYTGMTRQREESTRYEKRQLDYATGLEMETAVRKK